MQAAVDAGPGPNRTSDKEISMSVVPLVTRKPRSRIADRQQTLRARLWPEVTPGHLWVRQHHDGYSTMPRTMPLILGIMDDLKKGKPVSATYLDLWTRSFDESFVTLSKSREIAFSAGFTTQRGERTWRERMSVLAEFGFIDIKAGPSGPTSYALIFNPYLVIRNLYKSGKGKIVDSKYNALMARADEVGARDFDLPNPL